MATKKTNPRERAIIKIKNTIYAYLGHLLPSSDVVFDVNDAATKIYDYTKLHHQRSARKPAPVFDNRKKKGKR